MALKDVVAKRVLEDILSSLHKEGLWKVLILDHLSTRIISSCCKMSDVMSKGITRESVLLLCIPSHSKYTLISS